MNLRSRHDFPYRRDFGRVLKTIRAAEADEHIRNVVGVEAVCEYHDGRGGERWRLSGVSREAVMQAAQERIAAVDAYKSPAILSGPTQLPGGGWQAVVGWHPLGD